MDILIEEIKRRLFTKEFLISLVIILSLGIILNLFIIRGDINLEKSLKEESIYSGAIREENLIKALRNVRDKDSNKIKDTSQLWIIHNLVKSKPGIYIDDVNLSEYKDEYASDFYNIWHNKFKAIIDFIPENDRENANKELDNIDRSFSQYPGHYIYSLVLGNIEILFILIIFMTSFFAARTYSESYEDGSIEIIKGTKNYKKVMILRIFPVMLYGVILVLISVIVSIGSIAIIIGLEGMDSSIKLVSLFSYKNLNIKETIIIMTISGIIGIIGISVIIGLMSLKTKSTKNSMAIAMTINLIYILGDRMIDSQGLKKILDIIPMANMYILKDITDYRYPYSIWKPYMILIFGIIIILLFLGLIIYSIYNTEEN